MRRSPRWRVDPSTMAPRGPRRRLADDHPGHLVLTGGVDDRAGVDAIGLELLDGVVDEFPGLVHRSRAAGPQIGRALPHVQDDDAGT